MRLQLQPRHRFAAIGPFVADIPRVGHRRWDTRDLLVERDAIVCFLCVEVECRGGGIAEIVVPTRDALCGEEGASIVGRRD